MTVTPTSPMARGPHAPLVSDSELHANTAYARTFSDLFLLERQQSVVGPTRVPVPDRTSIAISNRLLREAKEMHTTYDREVADWRAFVTEVGPVASDMGVYDPRYESQKMAITRARLDFDNRRIVFGETLRLVVDHPRLAVTLDEATVTSLQRVDFDHFMSRNGLGPEGFFDEPKTSAQPPRMLRSTTPPPLRADPSNEGPEL